MSCFTEDLLSFELLSFLLSSTLRSSLILLYRNATGYFKYLNATAVVCKIPNISNEAPVFLAKIHKFRLM